ncbi:hypothetical protein AAF712_009900 [Marasmius tenuissimus]|uniref:DUF6589 domain-containing protein n=1 Tax=Marasmius tenuissimus TaxID=585030 RepID=A0ABR2ZPZ6_9AGAR
MEIPFHPPKSKRKKYMDGCESEEEEIKKKLSLFFEFMKNNLKWTYGELLYHSTNKRWISQKEKEKRKEETRGKGKGRADSETLQHAQVIQHFFRASGKFSPGQILQNWLLHPTGARSFKDEGPMYSTSVPYHKNRGMRQALTSFAVQIVSAKLLQEAEIAIDVKKGGLHVSLSEKASLAGNQLKWVNVGSVTVEHVRGIIQEKQPLTWELILQLAARKTRLGENVDKAKQRRPPEIVATHIISSINYSHSSRANLLPVATGLLHFGSQASADLFAHHSRIASMPAWTSSAKALRILSKQEAEITYQHGSNENTMGIIRFDNEQNYHAQRDSRIGRRNRLIIGLGATYYEGDGLDPRDFDLEVKRAMLDKNLRSEVTVEKLLGLIDHQHLETIGVLHMLLPLTQYIPQARSHQEHVYLLFRTRAAKVRAPAAAATEVHPLASTSKNEVNFSELKDGLLDFMAQTGQTADKHASRMIPIGGDGLSYEKLIQLKELLQFHENKFESMELIEPILEWWHAEWTNLSRIMATHWGSPLSHDPSTLGHSATKIDHKPPSNFKKVDYFSASHLVNLVFDMRVLDCWRVAFKAENLFEHFEKLETEKKLPEFEDLEKVARQIFRSYISNRAQQRALMAYDGSGTVPLDSTSWPSDAPTIPKRDDSHNGKGVQPEKPFLGDKVLARNIAFMFDAMVAKEIMFASADGDAGRVYEMTKITMFSFGGSSHKKYNTYKLETIVNLEYECTPKMKEGYLSMSLPNLSGIPGHHAGGDFLQEYFNRLTDAMVQRKGIEYGGDWMRNVWSRNLHHIARLKASWLNGLGLTTHGKRHTNPPITAEMKVLMSNNKENKISIFVPGRIIEEEVPNDFRGGVKYMRDGKVAKWKGRTTRYRGLTRENAMLLRTQLERDGDDTIEEEEDEEAKDENENENEDQPHDRAFGVMHLVDGQPEFFNAEREIDMLMSAAACDEWEESDDELPELRDVLWGASGIDNSDEEES